MSVRAAAVAYSSVLSIPPFLIALVSAFGLFASPSDLDTLLDPRSSAAPDPVLEVLDDQLSSVVGQSSGSLTLGVVVGLLFAIWSSAGAVQQFFGATNDVYDEADERNWFVSRALAMATVVVSVLFLSLTLGLLVAAPPLVDWFSLDGWWAELVLTGRWVALWALMTALQTLLFRYAPNRRRARLRWVVPPAAVGSVVWLAASMLLSLYASNFGTFNRTYGSLSAIVVSMLWLYLTALVILITAEVAAQTEHDTRVDSTTGPPRPAGERGAYVADHHPDDDLVGETGTRAD